MIKVIFPEGCYGTYLTRCLYNFTNLNSGQFHPFEFDDNGSSHAHRYDTAARSVIDCGHFELSTSTNDTVIIMLPDALHNLDYFNNQFYKQEHGELFSYIFQHVTPEEFYLKLQQNWGHTHATNKIIPRWILREYLSHWLTDSWAHGYNRSRYANLSGQLFVEVNGLFTNFVQLLETISSALALDIKLDYDVIKSQHDKFLLHQRFHNSQIKCATAVDNIIQNNNNIIEVQTIFDEAYIQHQLRVNGYELACDGLNQFPATAVEAQKLIYRIDHV
jgi:hypothetical protein